MKKIFLCTVSFLSLGAFAASINFSGHFRTEGDIYKNLGLGRSTPANDSKTFLQGRALVEPKIVIDDHFTIFSQWNLLTSPAFTPPALVGGYPTLGLSHGQGGYLFGDPTANSLVLSRAWLEWISDFGVVRIGRMPVSWGYGLVWDAGNGIWDDYQTTYDRMEYRLHLGHFIGAFAYSKSRKLLTTGHDSDQDFYSVFVRYDNPEQEVETGILFERQVRSSGQDGNLMNNGTPNPSNPYYIPNPPTPAPPVSTKVPYPTSNNVLDVYVKKTVGKFTFGGEGSWLSGNSTDYTGNGVSDTLNAFGLLGNITYDYHQLKAFVDVLYASGDDNLNADHLNGFVVLHRNKRPGIILGHELLGNYFNGTTAGQGSLVVYSNTTNSFSGVLYFRPGIRVDWSPTWNTGLEIIFAQKAAAPAGEAMNLGVEIDIGTEHSFYKNFDLGLTLGALLPGDGLGVSNPTPAYGVRTQASVKF